jgi:hypothetical protein
MRIIHSMYYTKTAINGLMRRSMWAFLNGDGEGNGCGLGYGLISTRSKSKSIVTTRVGSQWCGEIIPVEAHMDSFHA